MNQNDTEIVSALRAALAARLGQARYDWWFTGQAKISAQQDRLTIGCETPFLQDCLRDNFRCDLQECWRQLRGPDASVEFSLKAPLAISSDHAPLKAPHLPILPVASLAQRSSDFAPASVSFACAAADRPAVAKPAATASGPRAFKRLDTYILGSANRLAHAAASVMLDRPGQANPLYLHGPTGVGKTHLLEAIWCEAKSRFHGKHVIYLSAEQFTSQFVDACRKSGMPSFRSKFRSVEMLIIDDLQFISGKPKTFDELWHTINTLEQHQRQVVLAGDRAPTELAGLQPELLARLQGGMIRRIDPPDYPMRLGIVQQWAHTLKLATPPVVADFVARSLTAHARELVGAMNRLHATALATGQPLSLSLAEEALADLIQQSTRVVRLRDIEQAVCHVFGLEDDSLRAATKAKAVQNARALAMWLARKHTRAALGEISRYFGRRSHSSVVAAQKTIHLSMAKGDRFEVADRPCTVDEAVRQVEARLRTA